MPIPQKCPKCGVNTTGRIWVYCSDCTAARVELISRATTLIERGAYEKAASLYDTLADTTHGPSRIYWSGRAALLRLCA